MARDPKHDVLFESIKLGCKQTRNRFWQTSHCAGPGAERPGAQAHLRGMKAEGGWGVGFTEYCSIYPEADEYPYTSARIWDQGDVQKRMLFEKGVKTYCNYWVDKIEPGRVGLSYLFKFGPDLIGPSSGAVPRKDNGGEFALEVDAVILVTSRSSETGLWRQLKARKAEWAANEIQDVFRVGDCKVPTQLNQALWDAHRLAREFDSPHPAYPLPWIRERQLWGNPTVPTLGDPRVNVEAE